MRVHTPAADGRVRLQSARELRTTRSRYMNTLNRAAGDPTSAPRLRPHLRPDSAHICAATAQGAHAAARGGLCEGRSGRLERSIECMRRAARRIRQDGVGA